MDQFLGGIMYLSSVLIYSHQQDLLLLVLSLLNGEEVPTADLYIIASTSMDTIITSWRNARKSQSTLGHHGNQYFSRLDSMGPFAWESWITVHASHSWMMDSSILYQNAPIIPSSDHWRLMLRFRRMLTKGIIQHVRSCTPVKHSLSTPLPPPIPAPKVSLPGIVPKLSASVPLQTAPKKEASRVPRKKRGRKRIPPLYISVFIGRFRKKRKSRRHQRREFYHTYYRPLDPLQFRISPLLTLQFRISTWIGVSDPRIRWPPPKQIALRCYTPALNILVARSTRACS